MLRLDGSLHSIGSALLLSIVLAACASAASGPTTLDLEQRIEIAVTRADHEALALSYDREAAAARDKAATHRKMAKAYVGARSGPTMQAHCTALVRDYESVATEYDALATLHRQIATQ